MRNLSAVVSTFTTPDGDKVGLDSFVLSRSSIERGRQNDRQLISLQAKLEFLENLPEHLACHWDGKMIEDLLGILNEAEAIVASGGNGKYKEGKLLDIVDLIDKEGKKTSTGEAQAKAVYASLKEWGILDRIRAFVFDTTASNTGWRSGAVVRLNFLLGRVVLYCACRHHVMELLAKNPFHAVVGYDPSPDVAMFKKFQEIFPQLDTSGTFLTFDLEAEQAKELIKLYIDILTKEGEDGEMFVREDYRELAEISLVMVGGQLPGDKGIRWRPPGARHKARFMAFALVSLKILAFSDIKLVRDIVTLHMTHRIEFRKNVFTLFGKPESKYHVPTQVLSPPKSWTWVGTWNLNSGLPKRVKLFNGYQFRVSCVKSLIKLKM